MDSMDPRWFSTVLDWSWMPASWRTPMISLSAMITLAGLDFAGAVFAKEWTQRHHNVFFVAGLLTFLILFVVYAQILKVAELSIVTIGWVVFLQVGLVFLDRLKYGVEFSTAKWIAVGIILVLQAYLVLVPNSDGG